MHASQAYLFFFAARRVDPKQSYKELLCVEIAPSSQSIVKLFVSTMGFFSTRCTVPVAFSEARFQVKKSACFWRHGRYQE